MQKTKKPNKAATVGAVIIILLAAVGLTFIVDSAIKLITGDNSHDVAQCESLGGSWDGGCWYAGKLVDVNALMEDLYGE